MDLLDENGMWEEINDIDGWKNWTYKILDQHHKEVNDDRLYNW